MNMQFIQGVWNNRGWKKTHLYALDTREFPIVVGPSLDKFYVTDDLFTVSQAYHDYTLLGIRPQDYVIDIGANIGGFAVPISKFCKKVMAVEPLMHHELGMNLRLNNIENCEVWKYCLGTKVQHIKWRDREAIAQNATLTKLIEINGGCDFLKCDCEGNEREIETHELDGIRCIEMEMHEPYNERLLSYITEKWETEVKENGPDTLLVSARKR